MKITQISVLGLFNRFDHEISFQPDERIAIILGPNGIGKTVMLQAVNALFNHAFNTLGRMPFSTMNVDFDDGSILTVQRKLTKQRKGADSGRTPIEIQYHSKAKASARFVPKAIRPQDIGIAIGAIEDVVPELDQIANSRWRHLVTNETLDLDDVVDRFGDQLNLDNPKSMSGIPAWLREFTELTPVRLIAAERLTTSGVGIADRSKSYTYALRRQERSLTQRTVRRYSNELGDRIKQTLAEYGNLSQSLDSTFPARLVEEAVPSGLSMDDLQNNLNEIDAKRARMVEVGLLAQEQGSLAMPLLAQVDDAKRGVLAVYVDDATKKLAIFDDLYSRVDSLKRIINSRFQYKQLNVGANGMMVVDPGGDQLDLENLSSGEQHQLVLMYDLLFDVPEDSLILIDEPELSLHVAWQEQFLADLGEVADLSNFSALIATHSPQIIGDRWDLTIRLQGSNGS